MRELTACEASRKYFTESHHSMHEQVQNPSGITASPDGMSFSSLRRISLQSLSARPQIRSFKAAMAAYIFMLVLLPSGSIFGINVKVVCFLLLCPIALQVWFARGQASIANLVRLLLVPAILLFWVFLSQLYGFDPIQALAQYKDLMVTIATCWFAAVMCEADQTDILYLLRCVIYAEVAASSLKIALLSYALIRGIPISVLIELIRNIFGVQLMAFDFESALGRIQFISDNLIPIAIFAVLCWRKALSLRTSISLLMMFVLIISSVFSFSRYLWIFTVVALVLGLFVAQRDRFQAMLLTILVALTLVSLPYLVVVVTLRFSTSVVTSSDADRIEQVSALNSFIADAPWFGQGLGSYSHRVIRSQEAPYSYEAQLLALFGQVGIIGVLLLTLLTLIYFRRLWPARNRFKPRHFALPLLLLFWLAGGFFNPSVISSAASVSYAAIFAMAALQQRRDLAEPSPTNLLTT